MEMSFAVVQFGDDDGGSVSIVNSLWLTPRRCEVFWPPVKGSKAFEKLLKANTSPDEKWKIYGVKRIFCETDALNEAKRKLKLSEFTSDLDNVPEEKQPSKRPVKRTKRFVSDTSCASDDENIVRPPSLKKTELNKVAAKLAEKANTWDNVQISNCTVQDRDESITEINNDAAKLAEKPGTSRILEVAANAWDDVQTSNCTVKYRDESIITDLPSGLLQDLEVELGIGQQMQFDILSLDEKKRTSSTKLTEFQSKVISLLATLKTQNTQILEILQQTHVNTRSKGTLPDVFRFPLQTEKQLYENEDLLKNKPHYDDLVSYLKTFGGQDHKSKTRRILKYLISDSLACSYNFYGQKRPEKQKKPFNKLVLLKCIIETVITTTNGVSAKEIEESVKNWLKHAPERLKKNISEQ